MSYSFSVKATSKREAKLAVIDAFDRIVAQNPAHAADAPTALATADALINLLPDDADRDVAVGMYGSVNAVHGTSSVFGVGLTVNAYLTPRT